MRVNSIVIVVSFVAAVVAFTQRNALPGNVDLLEATLDEPRQSRSNSQPFEVLYNDVTYRVEPQYRYDITGMVVSYRHHDYKSRMHTLANDHLNMVDICVVWGDNADNPFLDRLDLWNGIFTCNVSTRDQAAWDAFDIYQISNNHLLSDDDFIRDQVGKIRVGDQIRMRGYLAGYSSPGVPRRGTSTTRLDTGDGACETLYVEHFEILERSLSPWRLALWVSLAVLVLSLIIHFRRPYKPY